MVMIFRRFCYRMVIEKRCKGYNLCLSAITIGFVYAIWQAVHVTTTDEYIKFQQDKGTMIFTLDSSNDISLSQSGQNRVHVIAAFFDDRDEGLKASGPVIRVLVLSALRDLNLHCCVKSSEYQSWICLANLAKSVFLDGNIINSNTTSSRSAVFEVMYMCSGIPARILNDKPDKLVLVDSTKGQYTSSSVVGMADITYSQNDHANNLNTFSVCVHPKRGKLAVNKQDMLEFIELVKLMGAGHLTVYHSDKTMRKIMGGVSGIKVDILHWKSPLGGHIAHRTSAMNDCLYRNMHRGGRIIFTDFNEILVPTQASNWDSLIASLKLVHNSTQIGAYIFQVVSFFDETTKRTASLQADMPTGSRLPMTVRFRLREKSESKDTGIVGESMKIHHITGTGLPVMMAGYSNINVPASYGSIHKFMDGHRRRLKSLIVDPSKDKLVPPLLKALQLVNS